MIDNNLVGEVKTLQQDDSGQRLSMFFKYMGRGKKKIFKGTRILKFSLKKAWEAATDTLQVLPFVAASKIRGS